MFLGLPLDTWALMVVATVPGLALVGRAYVIHREGDRTDRIEAAHEDAAKPESDAGNADG